MAPTTVLSWFLPGKLKYKFADGPTSISAKTNLGELTLPLPFMDRSSIDSLGDTVSIESH